MINKISYQSSQNSHLSNILMIAVKLIRLAVHSGELKSLL